MVLAFAVFGSRWDPVASSNALHLGGCISEKSPHWSSGIAILMQSLSILLEATPASWVFGSLVSKTGAPLTYNKTTSPFVIHRFGSAEDWSSPKERREAFIVWYHSHGDYLSPYRDLKSLSFAFGVNYSRI